MSLDSEKINDTYGLTGASASDIKKKMEDDSDDEGKDKDGFLNIYDENKNAEVKEEESTNLETVKTQNDT